MRHFAVIGSGPAGFYTVEALAKAYGDTARIDLIDRLPVPYGLIRFGVAPDHQSIKAVSRRYDKVAEEDAVRFVGNVAVGRDVTIAQLRTLYDAVILATGAPSDRGLGIPGEELTGVIGSAAFVGWYNGHPDFADLAPPLDGDSAAIIGNGNVALDVARILSKTRAEFAGSDIVDHALDALADAIVASRSEVDPKVRDAIVHGFPATDELSPGAKLGAFVVGKSALPALGQEGQLLAAWSAARVITRTDRRKEKMRREMWSKVELG